MATEPSTSKSDSAPLQPVHCDHCGLPVPPGLIDPNESKQFCCSACRSVWQAIHESGLESFYALRDDDDAPRQKASTSNRHYEEFDDPAFADQYVNQREDGLCEAQLYLEGVHCSACVWLVEKLPAVADGVVHARLDLRRRVVDIVWDPQATQLSRIARRLHRLGYPPHAAHRAEDASIHRHENRKHLIRIAIATACAGNGMLAAIALYAGDASGMAEPYRHLLRAVSALIGLIALAWPGAVFFRGAWSAIRTRTAHMDLPIALGLSVGGISGLVNTLRGQGDVYFDSLAVLVFMLLVGRYVQYRQQRHADERLGSLFSLTPRHARRVRGDDIAEVPVAALVVGDIVEVHAGESLPVDGIVIDGSTEVDASLMTGESLPAAVTVGQNVVAGTVNLRRPIRVRVEASGDQTRLMKLVELVTEAARAKPRVVQFADRMSGWFVVVVTLAATATFAAWWPIDPGRATSNAVALLIVACPCALGIATPLALAVAIGRAAQRGILIKSGHVLERLARAGTIVLDKTGTLTRGRMGVTRWWGDEAAGPLAAALESAATHPAGRAIADWTPDPSVKAADIEHHSAGVVGTVDGRRVAVGSVGFVTTRGFVLDERGESEATDCLAAAQTPIAIGVDGRIVAVAWIADAPRPDAPQALEDLRAMGWRLTVASGDQPAVVDAVAGQLGIDPQQARGNMSPEDKLELIRQLQQQPDAQPVVMVGDGVNDAAALAAASVGMAVHGGAEAALAAADAYTATDGLGRITALVRASRRTMRTIRAAMGISLIYNATCVGLAATGFIGPLIAALVMPASSFTVVGLALASRTFDE